MELIQVKQRFSIVGNSVMLNNALETAIRVAPTDMNVLILGDSGVGKVFQRSFIISADASTRLSLP
jgi:DNA-binding NtrC family response regulator